MEKNYFDEYIEIIDSLMDIRIRKGISKRKMAELLNVPQSIITKVEKLEHRLSVDEFFSWLEVLDVSVQDVIANKKDKVIN